MSGPLVSTFFLLLTFGCASTYHSYESVTGYDLTHPDQRFTLPDTLREISGLTDINDSTFACVQDENGILFIYSLFENKIAHQQIFNIDGDYEGITRVNGTYYILQSDGVIYEVPDYKNNPEIINSYPTDIPANNNEGLCYDESENRLLIACKGKTGKGKDFKDKRVIYGFDLATKQLSTDPVFEFDLQVIKQYATDHQLALPEKDKKKGSDPFIKFMTSAIAIHPFTQELYLLSATDHLFFIFSRDGKLKHMELLDPKLFNKAEGITFLSNGDMLITNEAQDKHPSLLRFNLRH